MCPDHDVGSPVGVSASPAQGSRRRRALVIDDDAGVRALLCEFLQLLQCGVRDAATGAEGLALIEEGDYDLVVTDLMMPDLTGWDVAGAVRHRARSASTGTVARVLVGVESARTCQLSTDVHAVAETRAALGRSEEAARGVLLYVEGCRRPRTPRGDGYRPRR